jgi:hypothetical protein
METNRKAENGRSFSVLAAIAPAFLDERQVVLIAEEEKRASHIEQLRTLFKTTQALPQAQAVSEDEIAAEIVVYRAGR